MHIKQESHSLDIIATRRHLFSEGNRKYLLEAYDLGMSSTRKQTLAKRQELAEKLGCQLKNIDVRLVGVLNTRLLSLSLTKL